MPMIYSFKNDYSEGAHPSLLSALQRSNADQQEGYGNDAYCKEAVSLLRQKTGQPGADVHFVSGGTQVNAIAAASVLKPYEAVISAPTGHINVHEAGAIEHGGHKVIIAEGRDGKLTCDSIRAVLDAHTDEHMVAPKLVYISNATETGTLYRKKELEALSGFCRSNSLFLYMDGARLGNALCSTDNDLDLVQLSGLVDYFSLGGTKNGALIGEALIIVTDDLKPGFRYHMKQHGALLSKSRLFGVQFLELFREDLFFDLARHANQMAARLSRGLEKSGMGFLHRSTTNQIFPVLPQDVIDRLLETYGFYVWETTGEGMAAVRLVTSWATSPEAVDAFLSDLKKFL